MENENYQNPYYGEGVSQSNTFGKAQTSLLVKSMLICGGGFALICGLSVLFCWIFYTYVPVQSLINADILFPVVLGSLLISMIISLLWMKVLGKGKAAGLTALIFIIYILTMSVGFGYLFARLWLLEYKIMFLVFGITAVIFALVALFAKVMSIKSALTFGKIVAIVCTIAGIASLAWLITFLIVGFTRRGGSGFYWASQTINYLCLFAISLSMMLYIVIDVKTIMAASEFDQYTGMSKEAPAVVWYFGFKLLSDIVNVLFLVVLWIVRIARRG